MMPPTEKRFYQIYGYEKVFKDKTCFKNFINQTCSDLINANGEKWFQESDFQN